LHIKNSNCWEHNVPASTYSFSWWQDSQSYLWHLDIRYRRWDSWCTIFRRNWLWYWL